jgi:hypothetical protein
VLAMMLWLCILGTASAVEIQTIEHPWRVEVGPTAVWWKSASRHQITVGAHMSVRYAFNHLGISYDVLGAAPQEPGPSYDLQYVRLHQAVMLSGFLGPAAGRGFASVGPSLTWLHTVWHQEETSTTLTQFAPGLRWRAGLEGSFLTHGTWSWHVGGVATSIASMDFDLGVSLGGSF